MRICYYGDDFTGSTDVLEALTTGGLRVILFMNIPELTLWNEKFAEYDGFGVAGVTRTLSTEQLEMTLKPALAELRAFGASITHYKVCSTFDSSPTSGSIGKVIDIAREVFTEQRYTPVLAGSPVLGRYTVFGNHFAAAGDGIVRLDRHPNLCKHPITPMNEADLRFHLSKQTNQSIGLMNVMDLEQHGSLLEERYAQVLSQNSDILLFDVLTEEHLGKIGGIISRESEAAPLFVVGSSGIEYALVEHWNRKGSMNPDPLSKQAETVEQLLVVSGSCSPVTHEQIEWALRHGYEGIRIPAAYMLDRSSDKITLLLEQAELMLKAGKSVILYTAMGPNDESIDLVQSILKEQGHDKAISGQVIGGCLGDLSRELIALTGLKRVVFAGGDTSGFAVKQLNIYALEMIASTVPGGPLCRAFSEDKRIDGLELVLKGGQVGPADFFEKVRRGYA
ncbi:four-carbon acid sugar kinase family protein [Paenibacillus sp. UNC451MF]|uniref:four-carbon acid sugar kinase family protein n=1 Tax=Paenibacillus sp. UNC451MF TaxID=1449063 RepID=UPI00048B89FC|nr:four-carbon acid sugar kinase family protein [Paenibacillus sp. UNC451MF]